MYGYSCWFGDKVPAPALHTPGSTPPPPHTTEFAARLIVPDAPFPPKSFDGSAVSQSYALCSRACPPPGPQSSCRVSPHLPQAEDPECKKPINHVSCCTVMPLSFRSQVQELDQSGRDGPEHIFWIICSKNSQPGLSQSSTANGRPY